MGVVLRLGVYLAFIVVIPGSAFFLKLSGQTGLVDNRLHPLLLQPLRSPQSASPLGLCRAQNMRQMHALLVKRIGMGGCETRLRGTEEETVWETSNYACREMLQGHQSISAKRLRHRHRGSDSQLDGSNLCLLRTPIAKMMQSTVYS